MSVANRDSAAGTAPRIVAEADSIGIVGSNVVGSSATIDSADSAGAPIAVTGEAPMIDPSADSTGARSVAAVKASGETANARADPHGAKTAMPTVALIVTLTVATGEASSAVERNRDPNSAMTSPQMSWTAP